MEQKHISCGSVCDRLPTHSLKYPWFLARSLKTEEGDTKHQIMYALYEIRSIYYDKISGLTEKRVRGCFHGWVIISHNVTWSLWNPVTSKMIDLPPLDGDCESIEQCVLTYPPNHPASVFMLTRLKSPTIVLCQLGRKVKRLRWKEMTYAKQVRSIIGDDGFLRSLTCCNGKVYAFTSVHHIAVQVDIVVKNKKHVISLCSLGRLPHPFLNACPTTQLRLKGYRDDLFYIKLDFYDVAMTIVGAVYLFKLNRSSMIWDELEDLKDMIFFISIFYNCSVFYRDAIASELGGYAHMILGGDKGRVIYSYDVKDKTISLSPMALIAHSSQWERKLHGDDGEIKCETPEDDIMVWDKNEEDLEPHILDIPFDILKMIMELCVGVEYLNFRATCKHCRLAAPMIQWRNETSVKRLQTYSLISPWLIMLDKHQGIITFIDPMFGDKYFMKTPQELTGDLQICCSRYGWLLLLECTNERGGLFFFNPFTSDIRKLPDGLTPDIDKLCFSHPPTSPDCLVVGLSTLVPSNVFIHIPSSADHSWTRFHMDFGGTTPHSFRSPTIRDGKVYALNHGALHVFFVNDEEENIFTNVVVAESPRGKECSYAQYILANCDKHHFVLVMVDEVGESVEVLKLNDSTHKWEKLDSLGRHMIYICGAMCLCVEAKTPEMENKIYFPLLHSKTGNIMFYSLETRRYHTFNGRNIQQGLGDFFGTKFYVHSHAWIQPSWS